MTEANEVISSTTAIKRKFSAEQVEKDCPARLQQISREIAERIEKAHKETKRAADHLIAVDKLLAEAKGLCDGGGFKKFRELLRPQLGKSQTYALLAIAAGKKTLAEHRTEQRERKRKSRVSQKAVANSGTVPEKSKPQDAPVGGAAVKAAAANSGTVPEISDPEAEAPTAPKVDGTAETTDIASKQMAEPTKPRKRYFWALPNFSTAVRDLDRVTRDKNAEFFAEADVKADDLARLGKFLTDVANHKMSGARVPVLPDADLDGRLSHA